MVGLVGVAINVIVLVVVDDVVLVALVFGVVDDDILIIVVFGVVPVVVVITIYTLVSWWGRRMRWMIDIP